MKSLGTAICILVFIVVVRSEYTSLQWSDCGSDPSITIHNLAVTPMPVMVPGNMNFTLRASSTRSHLNRMILKLSSKRKGDWFDIPVPCLFHVGSCTYDDTCTLLATMQRDNWAGVMRSIGGQIQRMFSSVGVNDYCPLPIQSLNIENYVLTMPPIPSFLTFLAEGDYETRLRALDHATNDVLICVDLKMTMKEHTERCTDWFCRMRQALRP
ncbi:ganglioside GM2 activator-like [Haliotis cracherodii]|uniref:ganglioside GM2 activator-like n=1 Tax=Haliotis cracherodii TaxID=6455 RepID=UPI0039ED7100